MGPNERRGLASVVSGQTDVRLRAEEAEADGFPAGTTAEDRVCWVCGGATAYRHCKIICSVCGFTRDCSDP